jgi:hypothetical protein
MRVQRSLVAGTRRPFSREKAVRPLLGGKANLLDFESANVEAFFVDFPDQSELGGRIGRQGGRGMFRRDVNTNLPDFHGKLPGAMRPRTFHADGGFGPLPQLCPAWH